MLIITVFYTHLRYSKTCVIEIKQNILNYSNAPLSMGDMFPDPSRCLKPQTVPNPIYMMGFFLYIQTYDKVEFIN